MTCTKINLEMERSFQQAFFLLYSFSKPQQGCLAVPRDGTWWYFSWLQLLAREPRGTSNSSLTFMPPLPPQRQALKWPHIPSHYSNHCSQETQVASPSPKSPGADLLLSGYFLIEGKKQAMLSCFASSCYSEHLILGSKQQEQTPTWSREWNLCGQQEKRRRDSSCYKTGPP